ncbi:unnamed protein product [Clonostachys solani]|uniref:Major facilitator superfamily (MFS) profile domain-containing protein n=1 Tax=Clonostachys solani TaxID=160281 RepID=A0A9N9YYX7_9HYPO|nr:unnamed protein product [Clonostachys solani]
MGKQPYFGLRGSKLSFAIFIVASVDLIIRLFGYDQGVMGGLLTLPSFNANFPEICTTPKCTSNMSAAEINHRSLIEGVSVSTYNLGCFAGAIAIMLLGDILGRRKSILMGSIIMSIGAILQASSFGLTQLIVGRVICGIGNGINTATVPVWQTECSKSHRRGQTVMAELSIVLFGVALSYWLDFGFSYLEPSSVAWRTPIAFQLIFSFFVICTIMSVPESPRWLILRGEDEAAAEIIGAIHDVPADDASISHELQAIRAAVVTSRKGSFKDLFATGKSKNLHRTLLAVGIQILQQVTGINLITYYAASIYEKEIGLSGFMSRILAACNGTEYFLATIPAIFLVERVGRRPLLLVGSIGMAVSMIILSVMTKLGGTAPGIVAATFLFINNTFFALGWCGLPWLIPAELVPLEIRAQANALATSANWIFNFLVVMITPVCFSSIGWRTYLIFAAFNAASIPIVYFLYPETTGRSLEEMDLIFSKSAGLLDVVKIAKTEPRHYGKRGEALRDLAEEVYDQMHGQKDVSKSESMHKEVTEVK